MAHFAEIDEAGLVLRVTVVDNADMVDEDGNESEAIGAALCSGLLGGRWVQTSYNGRIRGHYAGIGWRYDEAADVFLPPDSGDDTEPSIG